MKLIYHCIYILFLFTSPRILTQSQYPADYFRSPVDFPIILSGTFGELRAGHFHSGIDIKTGGVSGKNIYAVADGYVSRIKVSAYGFGKTLYVTHPNGYVSVYAHLNSYNKHIGAIVKQKHYEQESFELDVYPDKGLIPVKKGEVIAYSGNSGSSNGPHLHFEIRLESTQTPVNPLHFGFVVKDFVRPEINWLKVIPAGENSLVDGHNAGKVYAVEGWGEKHRLKGHDTIEVAGPFSLAIYTHDKLNDASNTNGVYSIKISVDGKDHYYHDLEKFDFSETRYINSLIDYEEYVGSKRRYQRSEIDPNNKLSIYRNVHNRGIIQFDDAGYHLVEYTISDFAGNISALPVGIMALPVKGSPGAKGDHEGSFIECSADAAFNAESLELDIPEGALYRDLYFEYNTGEMPSGAFSRIHKLHNDHTPVHTYCTLRIKPDSLPPQTEKLVIVRLTDDNDKVYAGGKWENGFVTAGIRNFGDYMIMMDITPPSITSVNISSGQIGPDRETVKVKIRDNLSGIKSYRATLNGKWILMEYDAKNDLLTYEIDERLLSGNNKFRLVVTDNKDNEAVFEKILVR